LPWRFLKNVSDAPENPFQGQLLSLLQAVWGSTIIPDHNQRLCPTCPFIADQSEHQDPVVPQLEHPEEN